MISASEMISRLAGRGVTLRVDGEILVVSGPRNALAPETVAAAREMKPALLAELQRQTSARNGLLDDLRDAYAERFAICLEAGDIPESEAADIAALQVGREFLRAFSLERGA